MALQSDVIALAAQIDVLTSQLAGVVIITPSNIDLTPIQTSIDTLKPVVDALVASQASAV